MCKTGSLDIVALLILSVSVSAAKGVSRLPTKEQLEATQQDRLWKQVLEAEAERPMKAARAKLKRERVGQYRATGKREVSERDTFKRLLRKSNEWRDFGREGDFPADLRSSVYRAGNNGPTVLIDGVSAAKVEPGESFVVSVNFSANEDSALVDIFYDVDEDTVVDPDDISLFAYLFPEGEGGPEAPFWVHDNSREDEDPTVGVFAVTVDDFPYVGISAIMQGKDGGGTGQAYLTIANLAGGYTASGTVSPVTAPALVLFFFGEGEDDEPWMTFTDPSGFFDFGFSHKSRGYFLGAMDVVLGIKTGGYLLRGSRFDDPNDLEGVTLDITRNAGISGSVVDAETGQGIAGAWIEAFSGHPFQFVLSYTTSASNSVGQFTLPLQGGRVIEGVESWHPDYMYGHCVEYPLYVPADDTVTVSCEMQPWPAFIEGVVTDAETDEPLGNINVEIRMWGMHHEPMMGDRERGPGDMGFWNDTQTDENGRYRLGSSYGQGELCAFDWEEREYREICVFPFLVSDPSVKQDLALHPYDGLITGVVTDASTRAPLPGADVYAFSIDFDWGQWDRTDEKGRYELPVVNGRYRVCAVKWREGYEETCLENIVVTNDTVAVDIPLSPPDGFIQGHVFDADTKKPIPGIGVDAAGDHLYYFTETDVDGFFRFGVDNGVYEVCFYDWMQTHEDSCVGGILVSDNTKTLDVYLSPIHWDGAITGNVTDEFSNPVPAWVGAVDTTTWEGNGTMTDMMDGEYLLPVNNGHYVAMALPFSPGYVSDFETGIVVNFDTVTVSFETPLVKIDALVRGSVVDTSGRPIKGAWVSAGILAPFGWDGPVRGDFDFRDETDSAGEYEIDVMGFTDRSYWIYADYVFPETGELWVGGRDSVAIHSGDTVLVDLELSPIIYTSEISGHVILDGEPVAGAEVRVYISGTDEFFSAFTDENGFYSLGIPNGDYTVCVFIWEHHLVDCGETFVEDFAAAMDFEFGTVGVSPTALLPERFNLHQNHPNPFNPVTTIRYDVPEWSQVRLTVFDLLGKEVKTLVNGTKPAGFHRVTWDGRNHVGQEVATGVYIYQLKTGEFVATKRLILLK